MNVDKLLLTGTTGLILIVLLVAALIVLGILRILRVRKIVSDVLADGIKRSKSEGEQSGGRAKP